MVRQIRSFAAILLAGACFAPPARAQDGDSQSPRPLPTLSERLQQFRQDLWGDNGQSGNSDNRFGADRKVSGQQRTIKGPPRPTVAPPESSGNQPPAAAAVSPNSGAVNTPALKPQGARRAQANNGAPKASLDEPADRATQNLQQKSSTSQSQADPAEESAKQSDADSAEQEKSTPEPRVANSSSMKRRPVVEAEEARNRADKSGGSGVLISAQSPVLSVEATGPRKMMIGREAQFVVKMHNAGAAANNVVVSVNIPSYVEVVSAHPSSGSAQAPVASERREPLEWRISRLEAKSSETLTLKLVPRKSTPLDLAVQWTFTPEASQMLVEVQEPKLAMAIQGPDEVLFGQSKIYKLTVSNPGSGDSENVTVGLMPIGRASEGETTHRIGTLRAGESKSIDVELTAHQAGVLTIKAHAFADGGLRTETAEQVLVRRANLQVEIEAPRVKYAGTVGTFHVKLVNAGNATAENVQVAAMLPPDAKYVSSNGGGRLEAQQGRVSWTVGTLQPGAQRTFELHCSLHAPGDNRMQFLSTGDGDLSSTATSATRVEALADLKLEVRDPQGPIAVGEDAVYEVIIRNRGTKSAEDIDLTVFFSEGLEAASIEGGPHEISSGQVVFKPISTLGAGEIVSFRVHAAAEKQGTHIFRAEVVCRSLQTKLATEETTHFYGDAVMSAPAERDPEPHLAPPRESDDGAGASSEQPTEAPAESGK